MSTPSSSPSSSSAVGSPKTSFVQLRGADGDGTPQSTTPSPSLPKGQPTSGTHAGAVPVQDTRAVTQSVTRAPVAAEPRGDGSGDVAVRFPTTAHTQQISAVQSRRLHWLGRRWRLSTDDFGCTATCQLVVNVLRLVAFVVLAATTRGGSDCGDKRQWVGWFTFVSLLVFLTSIGADVALLVATLRGSLNEPERRTKLVPRALTIRLAAFCAEVAVLVMALTVLSNGLPACNQPGDEPATYRTERAMVLLVAIFGMQEVIVFLCAMCFTWDARGSRQTGTEFYLRQRQQTYYSRFRCLLPCMSREGDNAMRYMSATLALLMQRTRGHGPTVSDVAAGLALVRLKQQKSGAKLAREYGCAADLAVARQHGHSEFGTTAQEAALLRDAAHYMEHAQAVYGWPLYLYNRLGTGLCRLCVGCCHGTGSSVTEFSSCCKCSHAALVNHVNERSRTLGAATRPPHVLYSCFWSGVTLSPFAVIVDHHKQAIVIAIRGTLSLADAIQDAFAVPAGIASMIGAEANQWLKPEFLSPMCLAHRGMFVGAINIRRKLDDTGVLTRATEAYPSYSVVITGHSLGAGLASCLAVLYHKDYGHKMRCWAMSPPGAVFSATLATLCDSFVYSIVLGIDVIPRLSIKSLFILRDQILTYFPQCRVNKWRLYYSFWDTKNYQKVFGEHDVDVTRVFDSERAADELNASGKRFDEEVSVVSSGGGGSSPAVEATTPLVSPTTSYSSSRGAGAGVGAGAGSGSGAGAGAGAADSGRRVVDIGAVELDPRLSPRSGISRRGGRSTSGRGAPARSASLAYLHSGSSDTVKQVAMYAPGRIIHLPRSRAPRGRCCGKACLCCCNGQPEYQPVVATRRFFEGIVVGRRMLMDHMPDRVAAALHSVVAKLPPQQGGPEAV